ncbi:hypothetical protein [Streptomyces antibioticus]|uniref:hypothetical protein n=1 Tax=Streptomyces antibioticus TaxID=1890 RepID=UPI0033AB4B89
MSNDFVFSTLIASHPDPATASRALATAEAAVLAEAEAEIAAAIDRNRTEHPDAEAMIARRLGMHAAERVVRWLREGLNEKSSPAGAGATPEFFQPNHLYAYDRWRFACATVTAHPATGERTALGWIRVSNGGWTTYAYSAAEWGEPWTDITTTGKDGAL